MPVPGTTMRSYRPQVQGVNGVVVSSHPAASMAGLDMLKRGGNAVDAGVAVGLALNIVHADDCGFHWWAGNCAISQPIRPPDECPPEHRQRANNPSDADNQHFQGHGGHPLAGVSRGLTRLAAQ